MKIQFHFTWELILNHKNTGSLHFLNLDLLNVEQNQISKGGSNSKS